MLRLRRPITFGQRGEGRVGTSNRRTEPEIGPSSPRVRTSLLRTRTVDGWEGPRLGPSSGLEPKIFMVFGWMYAAQSAGRQQAFELGVEYTLEI